MKKRLTALLLILLIAVGALPLAAAAEETEQKKLLELDRDSIESIELRAVWGERRTLTREHDSYKRILDKLENFTYTAVENPGDTQDWYANIKIKYKNREVGYGIGLDHVIHGGVLYRGTDRYYFNETWMHKALAEGRKHPFTDIPGGVAQWAGYAVQWAWESGIIYGTQSNQLTPNAKVDRAMLVTLLYRLEGEPAVDETVLPFGDVSEKAYYRRAVCWASGHDIIKGTSGTTFSPANQLTREQAALMLYRYAQYKKLSLSGSGNDGFQDTGKLSEESKTAIRALSKSGVIQGKTHTAFDPKGAATRAQAITMLYRLPM